MNIENILAKDFIALTRRLVDDGFVAATLKRIRSADRLRLAAVGSAGAAGAAVAASQFGALATALADMMPAMTRLALADGALSVDLGAAPVLATTLLFALVGGATALIVPGAR